MRFHIDQRRQGVFVCQDYMRLNNILFRFHVTTPLRMRFPTSIPFEDL